MNLARPIAIHFRRDSYRETLRVADTQTAGRPQGLMGREVASHQFLTALLRHGRWSSLEAIVETPQDRNFLAQLCRQELSASSTPRRVRVTPLQEFGRWLRGDKGDPDEGAATTRVPVLRTATIPISAVADPPARVMHFANPPEGRFAWSRQRYAPHSVAFSGVTHTLCSPLGLDAIWQLVTAPVQPYDRLISTSTAVTSMLRSTTDVMCQYLSTRTGGDIKLGITIEQLPLGVDIDHHAVASSLARNEARR